MVSEEILVPEAITVQYNVWAALLAPYVEDEAKFEAAVTSLTTATEQQANALQTFLDEVAPSAEGK